MCGRVLDYAKAHPDLREARPWQRLRIIRNAGSELPHDIATDLSDLFGETVAILPTYGMSEAMPIASPPLSYRLERPGSVGRILPTVLVEIIDHTDTTFPYVANGTVGEVTVKGPTVFDGYDDSDHPRSNSFTPRGYFRTGDLGFFAPDGSGWLHIVGRIKDMINAGGETIAPAEVEAALRNYPGWANEPSGVQLMAFARSHKTLGEDVAMAIAGTSNDIDLAHIYAWATGQLPFAMLPKTLVLVPTLPQTLSGKPTRAKFADRFNAKVAPGELDVLQTFEWQAGEAAPCLLKRENTPLRKTEEPYCVDKVSLDQVLAFVQRTVSSPVEITPDTHLGDAGVNSLAAVELSIQLSRQFQADLPSWVLSDYPTPRALHSILMKLKLTDPINAVDISNASVQSSLPTQTKSRRLRMLFLHGEGADADLMEKSLRATHWIDRLAKDIEFIFMDAPHFCAPMPEFHSAAKEAGFYDKPQYRSWAATNSGKLEHSIYTVTDVLDKLKPIDAIGGICDGALIAAIVASQRSDLKLLLSLTPSPIAPLAQSKANSDWVVPCRSIHLVSSDDELHSLSQQFEVVSRCAKATIVRHDRGHAVPVLAGHVEHEVRLALDSGDVVHAEGTWPKTTDHSSSNFTKPARFSPIPSQAATKFEPVISRVMARILGRESVERTQDFFNLGGDSLKALAFMQKLEKKFGFELPLEQLFLNGASVESLARVIATHTRTTNAGSVVSLNKSVSDVEIFALPTLSGHLTDYFALGEALECSARLVGIKPVSLASQSRKKAGSLSELAREAATTISEYTKGQEINLVGCSAAGIIAFETANVLREWGYDINCLALIDSDATSDENKWPLSVKYLSEWQKEISRRLRGKTNQRKRYAQLHFRAQLAYWHPSPLEVKWPIFFKAERGTIDERQLNKWRGAVTGDLEVVLISGGHTSLRELDVAARIAQCIFARMSLRDKLYQ